MLCYLLLLVSVTTSSASHLVELDFELGPEVPIYPIPKFEHFKIEKIMEGYELDGNWLATQRISANEHTGTHINCPYRFNPQGYTLDQIPMNKLFGPAVVIDIRDKVKENPLYELSAQDVRDWVAKHGIFPNNSIVLVNTGWSSRWPSQLDYFGTAEDESKTIYPAVDHKAVEALFSYRNSHNIHIETLGIDSPSLDGSRSPNLEASKLAASQNLPALVMLNNVNLLPTKGALLLIMPMKIKEGTGAPTRIWARIPTYANNI